MPVLIVYVVGIFGLRLNCLVQRYGLAQHYLFIMMLLSDSHPRHPYVSGDNGLCRRVHQPGLKNKSPYRGLHKNK